MAHRHPALPSILVLLGGLLAASCSKDGGPACVLGDPGSCSDGLVCASIVGGEVDCFAPVRLEGTVTDLGDGTPVEGALVVAVDANGSPLTGTAVTDAAGNYVLEIPVTRNADGTPALGVMTLVVTAADYDKFPSPPRVALAIDATTAVEDADGWLIANATTDVALLPLPGAPIGSTVTGSVGEPILGLTVIAVQGGVAVSTATTNADGSFTLFNVPDGATEIFAVAAGVGTDTVMVTVAGALSGVTLPVSSAAMGTVTGSINYANAPNGDVSSVILVPLATWDPVFLTGEAPAGLRAEISKNSSSFTITDVPPGDYVILAAYENDLLVRDPDETIGGTVVLEVTVMAGQTVAAGNFKITDALAVVFPGADGLEVINDPQPVFEWVDDSGEEGYEIEVYDAFGTLVRTTVDVAPFMGSGNPTYTYDGDPLVDGMIYQFRVRSWVEDAAMVRTYISSTEDLLGVFQYQAVP